MTGELNDGSGLNDGAGLSDGPRRNDWAGLVPRPPEGDIDPRFTIGLIHDVSRALTNHGYPKVTEWPDRASIELQQHLFQFLYGPSQKGQR